MSNLVQPLNFQKWINEHRHLLKPPVGNKCVWDNGDYIVMVVGGPNSRKDYHYNETPEFFYQVEGDMVLKIIDNGKQVDVAINEGDIYLLPAKVPHSPQRKENTVGLVIEYPRAEGMMDALECIVSNVILSYIEKRLHLIILRQTCQKYLMPIIQIIKNVPALLVEQKWKLQKK